MSRHNSDKITFGRESSARKALIKGLVQSLVSHGRIKTTISKAKELRRHVEKAITVGKRGDLHARRILLSRYPDKNTVSTILGDLVGRFKDRNGGYTRITKLGFRPGDKADLAYIEFVDYKLPELKDDTKVEGLSKEEQKAIKSRAKHVRAHRKTLRKIQAASRRRNRL